MRTIHFAKWDLGLFLTLLIFLFIYLALPQVSNPNPEYQTKLNYGPPLPPNIHSLLMYIIYTSTRGFARIGAMVANGGRWQGKQIVPESWINESTYPHSDLTKNHINYGRYEASGYMWMIDNDSNTVWTDGYGCSTKTWIPVSII